MRFSRDHVLPTGALLATVAIAGVASAAVQKGDETAASRAAGLDAVPASTTAVAARAAARNGAALGVVTYRNKAGRLCVAAGRLNANGQVGAFTPEGAFRAMPLDEGGNCTFDPEPVAFTVVRSADNPATAADETGVEIYGLAQTSVRAVRVRSAKASIEARAGREGAFIAELAAAAGPVDVSALMADGTTKPLATIPAADAPAVPAPSPRQVEEDRRALAHGESP